MANTYAGIARMKNIRKENEMTKKELVERIKAIIRKYFYDFDDEDYTAEAAIDDIKDLVGEI